MSFREPKVFPPSCVLFILDGVLSMGRDGCEPVGMVDTHHATKGVFVSADGVVGQGKRMRVQSINSEECPFEMDGVKKSCADSK